MELNREQIIKALACCANNDECVGEACPYYATGCEKSMPKDALSLIKELTEKVENYRNELGEVRFALAEANNDKKKLTEENERVRVIPEQLHKKMSERMVEERKIERKLAVRQMQDRLTTFFANDDTLKYNEVDADYINECIDQIVNEMIEGVTENG